MLDVCFILMPYAAVERPSIAIGLLKASLNQKNIKSKIIYANLQFAEEIGLNWYESIDYKLPSDLLGEWTFSEAAFSDFNPNHEEYFSLVNLDKSQQKILWKIRESATKFIDKLAQQVVNMQPKIVSCSSTFQQHCASLALLRRIRNLNPRITTVMGGANCESEMGLATHREFPWIDYVISGEGDNLFSKLCQLILTEGHDLDSKTLPYGVITPAYRNKVQSVLQPPRATIDNLDNIPTPDYDEYFETLNKSSLNAIVHPGLLIETSRGCWWGQKSHCTFCGLNGNGMTYRSKSLARVIEEFSELSRRYNIHKFAVVDNILSMEHLDQLLPILADQKERYELFYETKSNLTRKQVQKLVEAGVTWIQPGIEALHDSVLKLMKKGTNAAINVQLLKWSREYGLRVAWNMLCRLPGESDQWYLEMAQWLPLIIHLQPPSGLSRVQYHRFSPYFEHPDDFGLKIKPFKSYDYIYPLSATAIKDIAYFFEGTIESKSDNSLLLKIEERPGLKEVQNCLFQWIQMFQSASPPLLCMSDQGEELQIFDTRPCAIHHSLSLTDLHRKIYLICDRALTPREILKSLSDKYKLSSSLEEIQFILHELQEFKILVKLSSRFLSLAVSENMSSLCLVEENPGGYTHISCDDEYAVFGIHERCG